MNREYLEDYEQEEKAEFDRFLRKIDAGELSFEKGRYPPNERFMKLQEPIAIPSSGNTKIDNIWAQVPFSGSLILLLPSCPQSTFEDFFFKISEIPKIIDFIKETGKLQVALAHAPTTYEGLDYLDPFFRELNPPVLGSIPKSVLGSERELREAADRFATLASVDFAEFIGKVSEKISSYAFRSWAVTSMDTYVFLKLGHYSIVENIESLMIDDPAHANLMFSICHSFITVPSMILRSRMWNFTLKETQEVLTLPLVYQPQEIQFPCEIGKFLLRKLTYAPQGLDACKQLMYDYDAYDLRKVQEALNEGIVTRHPDIIDKNTKELSEILDNVWNDKTIPQRVKGLQIGVPLSMAVIGSVAAGPIGAAGGFLAGLGFDVVGELIDLGTEGLSERLAKLKTRSYQANIYDFKRKYKGKITG